MKNFLSFLFFVGDGVHLEEQILMCGVCWLEVVEERGNRVLFIL